MRNPSADAAARQLPSLQLPHITTYVHGCVCGVARGSAAADADARFQRLLLTQASAHAASGLALWPK